MRKEKVVRSCPMCGDQNYISVESGKAERIGTTYIQELFPELNPVEREFLKSGYCKTCQAMLFGNGSSRKIRRAS